MKPADHLQIAENADDLPVAQRSQRSQDTRQTYGTCGAFIDEEIYHHFEIDISNSMACQRRIVISDSAREPEGIFVWELWSAWARARAWGHDLIAGDKM